MRFGEVRASRIAVRMLYRWSLLSVARKRRPQVHVNFGKFGGIDLPPLAKSLVGSRTLPIARYVEPNALSTADFWFYSLSPFEHIYGI